MTARGLPVVVVFANDVEPVKGITGAAVGTQVVASQLADDFDVRRISVKSNGLGRIGSASHFQEFVATATAVAATLEALRDLAAYRVRKGVPACFYYLPSSSVGGALRDIVLTQALAVLFPSSKIVQHIRNGDFFEPSTSWEKFLRVVVTSPASRVIVLSDRLRPANESWSARLQEIVRVVPNTIDHQLVPPVGTRPKPVEDGNISVLYFSNFIETKGHRTVLEAADLLVQRKQGEKFSFSFFGKWVSEYQRSEFARLAQRLRDRGIRVTVGQNVGSRANARRLYERHDVVCLPSAYPAEAQPRSLLEGMANGCAVVATRYRGIPDLVQDGMNGFLIDRRDPSLLADALGKLLAVDVDAMKRRSQQLFETRFNESLIRQKLLSAFDIVDKECSRP